MKKEKAREQGLTYTGIYERDIDVAKAKIAKERISHPKGRIVLVTIPDSKYSRGIVGVGYSAYADDVYFAYERIESSFKVLESHERCRNAIKLNFELAMNAQLDRYNEARDKIDTAQKLINNKK